EARKHGKAETGLKQRPLNKEQVKRSALRRELKPRPQHKAPNAFEKAQEGLRQAHEKGRMQEQKSEELLKRQQHESARQKEYEKDL
ncbi:hypothetical protein ACPTGK_14580, partial [Enterococcus faecalis]